MIASLELLVVLVAVMVFVPYLPPGVMGHAAFRCSAGTDNKGNVSVVHEVPALHSFDGALFPVGGVRATSSLRLAPKRGQPACRCLDQ